MSAAIINLTRDIADAHAAAAGSMRNAVAHAIRVGELLLQAKANTQHGRFSGFLAGLPFSASTARGYMRLATLDPAKQQRVADMPLRAALLSTVKVSGFSAEMYARAREDRANAPESIKRKTDIIIPLGSFGAVMWGSPENAVRWFELHPVLWPDAQTVGLHYAVAEIPESGDAWCETSRRPVRADVMSAADLARGFDVPIADVRIYAGTPVLWTPAEVQQ